MTTPWTQRRYRGTWKARRPTGCVFLALTLVLAAAAMARAQTADTTETWGIVPLASIAIDPAAAPRSVGLRAEWLGGAEAVPWIAVRRMYFDLDCSTVLYTNGDRQECSPGGWNGNVGLRIRAGGHELGFLPYIGAGIGVTRFDDGQWGRYFEAAFGGAYRNRTALVPRIELRYQRGRNIRSIAIAAGVGVRFPVPRNTPDN